MQRVQVVEPAFSASDYVWAGGRGILSGLAQFAVVLFLVYFLLVTDDLYKRKIVKIAGPTLTKKKISVQIMDEINQQISGFLRVQVITSLIVAVATGAALWWFGVDNYIIWGLLAGIFNSIPYLGPIVVTGGLAVVTFMQFDDLVRTVYVSGHGARDHQPRRLAAHAAAHEPRGADEPRGDLRRPVVLELGVGRVGHDPRRPDADGDQVGMRPRRRSATDRRTAGRMIGIRKG